ncbi:T9SS type A sorting domain-containing protein [bacterium]|nr:T9SS type A sorting domain-containing protein [bacterium]
MRFKKLLLLTALFIFVSLSLSFCWEYIGHLGTYHDEGRDIAVCADGGFIITGRSYAWALGDYDWEIPVVKLNSMGEELWVKHYGQLGTGYYDAGWSVCATPDSGCLVAGKTQSPHWCSYPYWDNMLLVRTDKDGDSIWTEAHGEYYFDRAWCVVPIPWTNEFYLSGCTHSYGPFTPDEYQSNMWVMRIDTEGGRLYQNAWGNDLPGTSDSRWCCIAADGGVVIVGNTADHDTTYPDGDSTITRRICKAVVVKYDRFCNQVWEKIYDRRYFHYSRGITSTVDGGFLVSTYDGNPNRTWAIRLDENGDSLWSKHLTLDSTGTRAVANYSMVVNGPKEGFYFAGGGQGMGWILYTDEYCNEVWRATYDFGDNSENFLSCKMTSDSGCVAIGVTYSVSPTSYMDLYAARVDRFGHDVSYYHSLSGWIFNAITKEPIAGVTIHDNDSTYMTTSIDSDSVGIYYFDGVSFGEHTFIAEMPGYEPDTVTIDFPGFNHTDFYLMPTADFTISGTVTDFSSTLPIDEAAVIITTQTGFESDVISSEGNFLVESVPGFMPAHIITSKEGYWSDTTSIDLVSDTIVDIALIPLVGIDDVTGKVIGPLSLHCNPNPFNGLCRIHFSGLKTSQRGDLEVRIYDILGNVVTIMNDIHLDNPEVVWQPSGEIASGVYLVRAKAGKEILTKRIVLLK